MSTCLATTELLLTPEVARRFVARQAILNRERDTIGYELLFREGWENSFSGDREVASRILIDHAVSYGLNSLIGNTTPFLNCTREVILQGLPTLLPTNSVLEVLEDADVDDDLVSACRNLRRLGYRIALDDFDFAPRWEPLLPYTDFVKVDFRTSVAAERRSILRHFRCAGTRLLAEKIETWAEFLTAREEGFHLFQGYFFTKPVILTRPALPSVLSKIRLLDELNRPDLDFSRLVKLLREEAAVTFRLLRCANSALRGRRETLTNIHEALLLVGEEEFRKLARATLAAELCGNQPIETHRTILRTARFCELMASSVQHDPGELYIFGMLSVIQSALNLSPRSICEGLRLRRDLKDALSGTDNHFSKLLLCHENLMSGEWLRFSATAASLGYSEDEICRAVALAQQWADTVLIQNS